MNFIKINSKKDLPKQILIAIKGKVVNFRFINEFKERYILSNWPQNKINIKKV